MRQSDPPPGFDSWEQCRDYYALEALFLGQLYDRKPTRMFRVFVGVSYGDDLSVARETLIDLATKDERVHALLGLAELQSNKLGDEDAAVEAMTQALGAEPGQPRAVAYLADHYE